ncbi:U1 small nuclear ribonucleoprotein C [Phytophthora citrophthora]|uniref:U1 small nuclear ribonucleoprotein C n=1 Tax=Phytophthora citrophthora TaxID=4793 RepID=A0AAD9LT43_9STRA|nr:U1 small nuclear ribonucleoprotein C [Phytophthora citrophthora]
MPRYYCDYCDTYLTHDSQAGRKQHNRGWKHRENVKLYYEQFLAGQGVMMNRTSGYTAIQLHNDIKLTLRNLPAAGEWLRGPSPAGALPPRPNGPGMPGGYPPRGGPPRGMMPPPGPGMRPPMFRGPPRGPPPMGAMGMNMRGPPGPGGMNGPPPRSIYGPQ